MTQAVVEFDHGLFVLTGLEGASLTVVGGEGGEGSAIDALTGLIDFDGASGTVGVRTGTWMGPVSVNAEFRDSPAADLGEVWDDVVEFSCFSASGIVVGEFMDEVQLLTVTEAVGEFRVRICARGRAAGAERDDLEPDLDDDGEPIFVTEPVEFYLIQVWPAPATPAEVLKRGTDVHLRSAMLGTDRQTTHSGGPAPADPWKTTAVLAASKQIADVLNQRPLATDNLAELGDVYVQHVELKSPKTLFRQLRDNGLAPETCSSGVNPDWRWNEGHQCFLP